MMQITQERQKRRWRAYLIIISLGALFTVLPIAAIVYFREEIQQTQGYGYIGVFLVGVLCGISIIPAPTQLLVFTFGRILNPVFVGLIAGFGGAIGGITVYLTGAGVETVWSRFRASEQAIEQQPGRRYDIKRQVRSRFWSKGEAFYNRLMNWAGSQGSSWVVFITSAMPISPFYYPTGLVAGSLKMGLLRFFLISWAGKTVRNLIIAFAGYGGLFFLPRWLGI